jgi:hypothetical protein
MNPITGRLIPGGISLAHHSGRKHGQKPDTVGMSVNIAVEKAIYYLMIMGTSVHSAGRNYENHLAL